MKTVWIFSDRIRDQIRLKGFKSVRIRVQIFNIRYRIRIRILKSYIYEVDIESYLIRHDWHYPYSNPNSTRNIKTNMILMISVRIRSVFIPVHTSKDSMWRGIWKILQNFWGSKQGLEPGTLLSTGTHSGFVYFLQKNQNFSRFPITSNL